MIYNHTLGNETIHISQPQDKYAHSHTGSHTHSLCTAALSDTEAHRLFTTTKSEKTQWTVPALESRHDTCTQRYAPDWVTKRTLKPYVSERLSLQLLRTCRQIYTEACMIPIQNNIFTFHCTSILDNFLALSTPLHRYAEAQQPHIQSIRSLSLDIHISHGDHEDDWASLIPKIPRALPQIRDLTITIHEAYCVCWVESVNHRIEKRGFYKALRNLQDTLTELRVVRVMIEDGEFLNRSLGSDTWWDDDQEQRAEYEEHRSTLPEKQERAKMIERWIMGEEEEVKVETGCKRCGGECEKEA